MNGLSYDRLPPQHIDLEKSVLAAGILYADYLDEITEYLTPDDFYRSAHQKIFAALLALQEKNDPVDLELLSIYLQDHNQLEDIGGSVFLAQLVDAPIPASVKNYCRKIHEAALARKAIALCAQISSQCYEGGDAVEIVGRLQTEALRLDGTLPEQTFIEMPELTEKIIDAIREKHNDRKNKGVESGIRTGFPTMDRLLGGGLTGPLLVIIAARPGHGKTSLMRCFIRNMAIRGVKVGVFSLEMSKESLSIGWLAQASGVNGIKLLAGDGLSIEEWEKLFEAADKQQEWPVVIDDSGGLTIEELKRRARKMMKMGAEIIFIDQLSKIRGTDKFLNKFDRYEDHVVKLSLFKKELGVPIVLLTQISRKFEDRAGDHRPRLADLKMTGSLEEEADIVLLGYRKGEETQDPADADHAEWQIAKNRLGPTYRVENMRWDGKTMSFYEVEKRYDGYY